MSEAVEVYNRDYVMGERMETPNAGFSIVRMENYTELYDESGTRIITLPPQWSIFDIDVWCCGYKVGYQNGIKRGETAGRDNAREAVLGALGIRTGRR